MVSLRNNLFLVALLITLFLSSATQSLAQRAVQGLGTLGVAQVVEVKEKNVKDGSVISSAQDGTGAVLTTTAYDPQVVGIVARDAAILLETDSKGVPVISTGRVYILVSAKNGIIKKGDLLTSSTIAGVAVKADKDGYVLGTALENADPDPKRIDKIAADLNLHYFNSKPTFPGSLSDILKLVLLPTKDAPSPIFKYIVAAGVVIASIILGFMSFGRTAAKGVEALGRNPSASKIIHLGIIFNIVIVVVIIAAGLTIGFLILRL